MFRIISCDLYFDCALLCLRRTPYTMGESRMELLAWMNDLLQTAVPKIELLGTGAHYCQIMDSIYGDIPISRVKFNAKMEYEYVANFKILQASFDKHKVDKAIPVTRLVKCKMQDNLEFTQWLKKYWDSYFPGGPYDAVARRAGAAGGHQSVASAGSAGQFGAAPARSMRPTVPPTRRAPSAGRPVTNATGRLSAQGNHARNASPNQSSAMVQDLTRQMAEMRVTVDGLEKERDFYFQKLRDIEVLVQQLLDEEAQHDADGQPNPGVVDVLTQIQQILYSTEEGFEIDTNAAPLDQPHDPYGHDQLTYEDDVF